MEKAMSEKTSIKSWFKSGDPWVWMNAGAVSISVVMVVGLLMLIAVRGLSHFWPADIAEMTYLEEGETPTKVIGESIEHETVPLQRIPNIDFDLPEGEEFVGRTLLKVGNREFYNLDFCWINDPWVQDITYPEGIMSVERREWGNFYGYLVNVKEKDTIVATGDEAWDAFQQRLERSNALISEIKQIEKSEVGKINKGLEDLRLDERRLELKGIEPGSEAHLEIEEGRQAFDKQYAQLRTQLDDLYLELGRDSITVRLADGQETELAMSKIVHAYKPNGMGVVAKMGEYFWHMWEFVSGEPREANIEGGIFPAIFGTVMMVIIMSILVTPFGVVAAVYLREYAKQGPIVRLIRIAVNNLAGVPSIVYGVFGLGFFVYFVGGNIDDIFFQAKLPAPTFGSPGMLWAALTLAILTVPVVIVATEEGLSRIPRAIREGSLALGATKAETLWRTVLPMAAPAMMTGLILAVARAAGEVAPLMMVGVVKLAPELVLDNVAPYLHLDRQFMHLGFHIYDVGFQSPNVEAARPLVYATAFLLVMIIIILNLTAIAIRNRLRENYKATES
jgi:phosphate transport system permease protein